MWILLRSRHELESSEKYKFNNVLGECKSMEEFQESRELAYLIK